MNEIRNALAVFKETNLCNVAALFAIVEEPINHFAATEIRNSNIECTVKTLFLVNRFEILFSHESKAQIHHIDISALLRAKRAQIFVKSLLFVQRKREHNLRVVELLCVQLQVAHFQHSVIVYNTQTIGVRLHLKPVNVCENALCTKTETSLALSVTVISSD